MIHNEGYVQVTNVSKSYGNKAKAVLKNVDFAIDKDEFICIIGQSGCGKSTLIRLICGLDKADKGTININGEKIVKPSIKHSIVFQEPRLLPWLNVAENLEFALKKHTIEEKQQLVDKYLKLIGLVEAKKLYPHQLSGGMAQRIAIARALVNKPDIVLLDEPFGALDALTRLKMQKEITNLCKVNKTTMLMVTHDIEEAINLADRVLVMSNSPAKIKCQFIISQEIKKGERGIKFLKLREKIYQSLCS